MGSSATLETLAVFPLNSGGSIRLRRMADGKIDLRKFDALGPGNVPCVTKHGLELPVEMVDDLVRALRAAV